MLTRLGVQIVFGAQALVKRTPGVEVRRPHLRVTGTTELRAVMLVGQDQQDIGGALCRHGVLLRHLLGILDLRRRRAAVALIPGLLFRRTLCSGLGAHQQDPFQP